MLLFKNKQKIIPPFYIAFLCGSRFNSKSPDDKRTVLKKYLSSIEDFSIIPIILEEFFAFRSIKGLSIFNYRDIGLNNLRDIETLTTLFSDFIFVIHESYSTAAEIGLFSYNNITASKTCILYPDEYSINNEVFSNFFKLAFFNKKSNIFNTKYAFYPQTKINYISYNNVTALTYFYNNELPKALQQSLFDFCCSKQRTIDLSLSKKYKKIRHILMFIMIK